MHVRPLLAALALAVVAASSVGATTSAEAVETAQRISKCGQAITSGSVYFDRDLTCSTGFEIPLILDDESGPLAFTIDMRGHRLRGTGSGDAFSTYNSDDYFKRVTLTNGRIDNWDTGFSAVMTNLHATKIVFSNNKVGLHCAGTECDVKNSTFKNNGSGTTMNDAALTLTRNLFVRNEVGSDASTPGGFAAATYLNNAFTNNGVGVSVAGGTTGVQLTENAFTRNGVGVRGGPYSELGVKGFTAALDRNLFVSNRDGVTFQFDPNEDESAALTGNVAIRNTRYGFNVPGAIDGGGNKAARNGKPCVGVVCARP